MATITENISEDPLTKKIPLREHFGPTIQGEGLVAGQRTYFLRFGLCDYKCAKCDSMHAVDPNEVRAHSQWLTQHEIYDLTWRACDVGRVRSVTYSGGNPCIHDLGILTTGLIAAGIRITVETQGTFAPEWLRMCKYVTVSPKGPGMGEKFEEDKFLQFLGKFGEHPGLCVKVVVFSARDLVFAQEIAEMVPWHVLGDGRFYLSQGNPYPPILDGSSPITHQELIRNLNDQFNQTLEDIKDFNILARFARFLPQIHVHLWGNTCGH